MENEKTARAVDKLDNEAAAAKSGLRPAYDAIAQMMRDAVRGDARACECVLDVKKTVGGAYDALRKYASDNRGGSQCVCVPPDVAAQLIAKYYGFEPGEKADSQAIANPDDGSIESLFDLI